ncbi:MAG: dTDP-4-dehydrorhamnose 3,5-epimerase [Armatimonadetes bacterium]|nr:dTDP-4-dehydrorhamnose 3,5-epimerase [Armatimonadota bacterium]
MVFTQTTLEGAYIIDIERREDERGFFARSWCQREFEAHGLNPRLVQCDISLSLRKGTLRGMHYQAKPYEEAKLVRCTRGAVHDVIVDIRPESPTFAQHLGIVLASDSHRMLYVPEGFAHGFLTLSDDAEVFYQMSEFYAPDHAQGFRWNDPAFEIEWPSEVLVASAKDLSYPDFVLPER